jgi:hypothetical protein
MQPDNPSVTGPSAERKGDPSKLVSLLALAAGAAALPQTSKADIIFFDLSTTPVSVGTAGVGFFSTGTDLPGGVELGFRLRVRGSTSLTSIRYVSASKQNGYIGVKDTAGGFIAVGNAGQQWNQIAGVANAFYSGAIGLAKFSAHSPNSYNNKYLAFLFRDSTQAGSPLRYGWAGISLSNANLSSSEGPLVTITGYAYDNTGAQIPMGAMPVPEPSTMALLALGALTLGAKGVRSWRRNRENPKSEGRGPKETRTPNFENNTEE